MIGKKGFQPGSLNPSKSPQRREELRQMRLGKVLTESQKRKISRSMKTALRNPVLLEKWRQSNMGRKMSEETKLKIRKTKREKPKSISTLKSKADKVFALYIRLRDSTQLEDGRMGKCITCEKWVALNTINAQAGHFISRRHMATRFDERNVNLQCAYCNGWGGGEQYKYSIAVDKKYGSGTALILHELHNTISQLRAPDYIELIDTYEKKIEDLKNIRP